MIQTWLRKKGFEVEKATSVKVAIQVCEEAERGFDLVLSDLRLPDHDGIFLLQWMRKHGVQVPFIVMTSYAEIQNVVLAMKSGATDYVANLSIRKSFWIRSRKLSRLRKTGSACSLSR